MLGGFVCLNVLLLCRRRFLYEEIYVMITPMSNYWYGFRPLHPCIFSIVVVICIESENIVSRFLRLIDCSFAQLRIHLYPPHYSPPIAVHSYPVPVIQ